VVNPDSGFLASANNKRRQTDRLLGYFFTPDDRVERMAQLVTAKDKISVEDLKRIQLDAASPVSHEISKAFVRMAEAAGAEPQSFLDRIAAWDGVYAKHSRGAPAFEALLTQVVQRLYADDGEEPDGLRSNWSYMQVFLLRDIEALTPAARSALFQAAVPAAARMAEDWNTWGDIHRLRVGYILSAAPVAGDLFTLYRVPIQGSRETLWKSAHGLIEGPHDARFGAQSRHVSDMSDRDANWFILFGGNDGWLGSANFADQVPLYLDGEYLKLPLDAGAMEKPWAAQHQLAPEGS